jgi:hypothetical protein
MLEMVHYKRTSRLNRPSLVSFYLLKKQQILKIKKQNLWPCFIIDKGIVIDIKKQILNFILIDTEILFVKFDKGQL